MSTVWKRRLVGALLFLFWLGGAAHSEAKAPRVGDVAPAFELPTLAKTHYSSKWFKGKYAVLVAGTTEEAAEDCKDWMLALTKNFSGRDVAVLQVVILGHPWYIPRFLVYDKLGGYVPSNAYKKVLIEWDLGFAKKYHIPRDNDVRIIVIDPQNKIRFWHKGGRTDKALLKIISILDGQL